MQNQIGCRPRGLARHLQLCAVSAAMLWLTGACGSVDPAATNLGTPVIAGSAAPASPVAAGAAGSGASANPITTAPTTTTTPPAATPPATPPGNVPPSSQVPDGPVAAADILPCGVSTVLANACQTCHSAMPIAGAPMPLVTYADLHKPAITAPTKKVYELVQTRIHDPMRPMPPTTQLAAADLTTLDGWLTAGAKSGVPADANCPTATTKPTSPTNDRLDGSRGRLTPLPNEECYEFKTHNSTTSVDMTPYDVGGDGEHYEQFYFKVPWGADRVATAYATNMDNAPVLHHWLLFSTDEMEADGFHKTAPLPTLIGTNPMLLAGWAVGGPNLVAPADVGFELPNPGKQLNVQWHFYNSTGSPQKDASSVQICTVPKAMVKNVGGITWLGTEDLGGNKWFGGAGMPAHQESTFTTTCTPGRGNIGAQDSIHIIGFEPHMHRIGKRMTTSVLHTNGMMETLFDKPFSFGNETHYYQDYEVKPGEKLITSCTFNNDTNAGVPFGESSDTEMCYQFTFAWPNHALSNGAASLLGVPDTCW